MINRTPLVRLAPRHRVRRGRRLATRAQAIVETAFMLPVLLAVFAGGFSITQQVTDGHLAAISVDGATRLAAQIGSDNYVVGSSHGCQSSPTDPCEADAEVLATLMPLLNQINNITVSKIVIFEPGTCSPANSGLVAGCPPDTAFADTVNRGDVYNSSGGKVGTGCSSRGCYTLDLRIQTPPLQTSVGIQVTYVFTPPTHVYSVTETAWASYRLDPVLA